MPTLESRRSGTTAGQCWTQRRAAWMPDTGSIATRLPPSAAHRRSLLAILTVLLLSACSAEMVRPLVVEVRQQEPIELPEVRLFGAFTYGGVWSGMEPVQRLEAALGRRLDVVHWFTSWDDAFYPAMVEAVAEGGRAPLISWQPMRQDVRAIADGAYDDYVRRWAQGVAAASGPVYIRPFPEMNGDWVPWNGDPEALRKAWRRMAAIFAEEGAENVRWVFGPNVTDEPRVETNRMERYYPGHDVVDVLAMSGFNWGETRPAIGWRSFEQVFERGYERLAALGPQHVWLAEIASSDAGGDKAAWVRDMFLSDAFPRLEAIVWFDEDKEADWRITSSPEVLDAFRVALAPDADALTTR